MITTGITEGQFARLEHQLDVVVDDLTINYPLDRWERAPKLGKWNAREHLAHLSCYQGVFLSRMHRLASGSIAETLPRYVPEEDPNWPMWQAKSLEELAEIFELRGQIMDHLAGLTPEQMAHTAPHSLLGVLDTSQWLEFFLLHEAHHMLTIFKLVKADDVARV